jgi:hypothetical protein
MMQNPMDQNQKFFAWGETQEPSWFVRLSARLPPRRPNTETFAVLHLNAPSAAAGVT